MQALPSGLIVPEETFRESIGASSFLGAPLPGPSQGIDYGLLYPSFPAQMADDELYMRGIRSDAELAWVRNLCRFLARRSAYAINAHGNRINYIVGKGHTYKVVPKKGEEVAEATIKAVQDFVDEFCWQNKWTRRQKEALRRYDRDGECFIRMFKDDDGTMRVRFVEPSQIYTPKSDPLDAFGIKTAEDDVETVEGYWIDGALVSADEVQHRKANVDCNVRRGLPLMWPVVDQLGEIRIVRRNMAAASGIQTRVGAVRKVKGATKAETQAFVDSKTAFKTPAPQRIIGLPAAYEDMSRPGEILTTSDNIEYEFPFSNTNYSQYVEVIQDCLREVASLLMMPEFMLTSDASNANYSSTMVAEGPAVKMFESEQATVAEYDLEILWAAIRHAIASGKLPVEVENTVEIQVGFPQVQTRDKNKETERRKILLTANILSPQTFSEEEGLEYDQEQTNIDDHLARVGGARVSPMLLGDEDDDPAQDGKRPDDDTNQAGNEGSDER